MLLDRAVAQGPHRIGQLVGIQRSDNRPHFGFAAAKLREVSQTGAPLRVQHDVAISGSSDRDPGSCQGLEGLVDPRIVRDQLSINGETNRLVRTDEPVICVDADLEKGLAIEAMSSIPKFRKQLGFVGKRADVPASFT